jgi:hypothetical protein
MSELAAMLSDLHDGSPTDLPHRQQPETAREPFRTKLPDWASEEALDAAFADWVPGPQLEASAAERSLFSDLTELADAPLSVDAPFATGETAAVVIPEAAPPVDPSTATERPATPIGPRDTAVTDRTGGATRRFQDDILPDRRRKPRWFSRR